MKNKLRAVEVRVLWGKYLSTFLVLFATLLVACSFLQFTTVATTQLVSEACFGTDFGDFAYSCSKRNVVDGFGTRTIV